MIGHRKLSEIEPLAKILKPGECAMVRSCSVDKTTCGKVNESLTMSSFCFGIPPFCW